MGEDADQTVEALKRRFRAPTDQALAARLKLGRSTVTSWRRRGTVPERYARLAKEVLAFPPDLLDRSWSPVEHAAMTLALVRLIKGSADDVGDFPRFLSKVSFLAPRLAVGLEHALIDLSARMTEAGIEDPTQCLNLIVFEEFFAPK